MTDIATQGLSSAQAQQRLAADGPNLLPGAAPRELSSPRALVIRDGARTRIAGAEVGCGDLIVLAEGDRVPADAQLVSADDLMLDESLLSGESFALDKRNGESVHSGTLIVRGHGQALVTATGARTEFGRIDTSLATLESEKNATAA